MTDLVWRTSSYSGGSGNACVGVADGMPGAVPVRDTKQGDSGPVIVTRDEAWAAFLGMVASRSF
ncbi:DUF397 domain-containing protein [Streptomyces sp. SBT349]|uniref:DUF397 domain-containing protein n=1 Tax=Streptomyces sp. SBT349 TaxID=1580539 RepID=UPI00066B648A|nr:DUF397 domain-containing protein [Streptomyces sp. SBT349]